ncbi:DNA-binding transcriptional regulator, FadR family [Actinopolyspora alba]|uniref:DNA-binding transcriptional regulator, FadR family n=1 Tax=Actinopolyspora alba TaxID=673379 RepID=A0A1I1TLQ2_9ACTN|nr:FCD domain-containing protein [Actinopolyspora alba]SFD59429.1 DNA-binding transcriptional regulator, FadR family [Actinopolyspora alba]
MTRSGHGHEGSEQRASSANDTATVRASPADAVGGGAGESNVEVLHSGVLDTLGKEITDGRLPTGHVLTLDLLEERFGVSRTVVRESVRVLQSMGLVTSRRRVGITVQPRRSWNVFDPRVIWWRLAGEGREAQLRSLTELRIAVEPLATADAARNASGEVRSRVVELSSMMRAKGEAGELDDFLELDIEFHTALLRTSGNEMFEALADVVAVVLRGRTQLGLMPHQPVPRALDLHERAAHAVANARSEEAEDAMRELLAEVRDAVVPVWGNPPVGK